MRFMYHIKDESTEETICTLDGSVQVRIDDKIEWEDKTYEVKDVVFYATAIDEGIDSPEGEVDGYFRNADVLVSEE